MCQQVCVQVTHAARAQVNHDDDGEVTSGVGKDRKACSYLDFDYTYFLSELGLAVDAMLVRVVLLRFRGREW